MPLWIPILIIVGLITTTGVVAAVVESLKSTRFAVLGARETGKTALLTFLTQGTLPTEYVQDVDPRDTKRNTLKLADLKFRVKEGIDVPGAPTSTALGKKTSGTPKLCCI